jgi:hypothetical protein
MKAAVIVCFSLLCLALAQGSAVHHKNEAKVSLFRESLLKGNDQYY